MIVTTDAGLPRPSAEALFRFQVVSQVLSGKASGRKLAEVVAAVARGVHVAMGGRTRRVSRRTLYRWLAAYQSGGLVALAPRGASRIEDSRVLSEKLRAFVATEKLRDRRASIPELIRRARELGVISAVEPICRTSVFRFLVRQKIPRGRVRAAAERDSRRFAYPHRLQMVLADGKHFRAGVNRLKRVGLFFIDDATRMGLTVSVGASENTGVFLRGFYELVTRFGFPDAVYVDKGPGFISEATLTVFARLGIPLIHGETQYPEGHGKIERFNQTTKAAVLRQLVGRPEIDPSLTSLGLRLDHYLREVYNQSPHEGLEGATPWERFGADEKPLRLPEDRSRLQELFCIYSERLVSPDHVVSFGGDDYEVPRGLAGQTVTLSQQFFDERVMLLGRDRAIEIFPVDLARNARERRGKRASELSEAEAPPVPSAAELAFNRSFAPVVDSDGGFPEPKTSKGRTSK